MDPAQAAKLKQHIDRTHTCLLVLPQAAHSTHILAFLSLFLVAFITIGVGLLHHHGHGHHLPLQPRGGSAGQLRSWWMMKTKTAFCFNFLCHQTVQRYRVFYFTGPTPKSSKCQLVSKCFQKKLEYLDWSPLKFLSVRTGPLKISKCLDWSPPFPLKSLSTGRLPFCKCKSFYTHWF